MHMTEAEKKERINAIKRLRELTDVVTIKQVITEEITDVISINGDRSVGKENADVAARSEALNKCARDIGDCVDQTIFDSFLSTVEIKKLIIMHETEVSARWLEVKKNIHERTTKLRSEFVEKTGDFFFEKLALRCIYSQMSIIHELQPNISIEEATELVSTLPQNLFLADAAKSGKNMFNCEKDKKATSAVEFSIMGQGDRKEKMAWDWDIIIK
jgi:hypothetical protein